MRVAESDRPGVTIFHDGRPLAALRRNEFDGGLRAGFCNMGACQDCWVVLENGSRIRACTTEVQEGMRVCAPESVS